MTRYIQEMTAPAIADYALIGDCRTAALVSRDGSVDWLCLPNFSSTSVFARVLDPRGGCFSLRPTQPFTSNRRYIDSTAVLETTFETDGGSARIFDCLPIVDGVRQIRRMREVLRIVEGVSGTISFHVSIASRPEFEGRAASAPRRPARAAERWRDGRSGGAGISLIRSRLLLAKDDRCRSRKSYWIDI